MCFLNCDGLVFLFSNHPRYFVSTLVALFLFTHSPLLDGMHPCTLWMSPSFRNSFQLLILLWQSARVLTETLSRFSCARLSSHSLCFLRVGSQRVLCSGYAYVYLSSTTCVGLFYWQIFQSSLDSLFVYTSPEIDRYRGIPLFTIGVFDWYARASAIPSQL